MAFSKNVDVQVFGDTITINEAYFKITKLQGNKHNIEFELTAFKNAEATIPLFKKIISFVPSDKDNSLRWDKQAYNYAKTLDEFSDVVDC